jgi:hypothetical protein
MLEDATPVGWPRSDTLEYWPPFFWAADALLLWGQGRRHEGGGGRRRGGMGEGREGDVGEAR